MISLPHADLSTAYRVPWQIERTHETHPLVSNASTEAVHGVRVFRSDGDTAAWGRIDPGEAIDLCLCDADLDTVIVTVCWFRSTTEVEYAWRFVM